MTEASSAEKLITAFVGVVILSGVGLLGYEIYESGSPVLEGTVITTTYDSDFEYTQLFGRVPVVMPQGRWTVQVDTDGDGRADRDLVISKAEFNSLKPGDRYKR